MRAGGLDQKIQLLAFHAGSSSTNQRTKGTKTQLSEQDGAMAYVTAYQFYIRRRSGITGNMRIRWKERTFELLGPPIDWKNEKNGLTLMAREVT